MQGEDIECSWCISLARSSSSVLLCLPPPAVSPSEFKYLWLLLENVSTKLSVDAEKQARWEISADPNVLAIFSCLSALRNILIILTALFCPWHRSRFKMVQMESLARLRRFFMKWDMLPLRCHHWVKWSNQIFPFFVFHRNLTGTVLHTECIILYFHPPEL